ncbi:MAG: hypothetical protein B7X06_00070 [Verrucomicrobia bacterium 21-51-4]|nr:MAG: hypothetical protein B7X06_00070 [Verrucomicrobia bacterium 21-51-4]HQU08362.1 hypothetical protein [Opitutales bacterium]
MITTSHTAASRELTRRTILLQLESASPISLSIDTLHNGLTLGGIVLDRATVLKELDYLQGSELITSEPSELSAGLSRYKLNHAGRSYLEREHLI